MRDGRGRGARAGGYPVTGVRTCSAMAAGSAPATIRFRPASFARYSRRSARRGGSSDSSLSAMPAESVTAPNPMSSAARRGGRRGGGGDEHGDRQQEAVGAGRQRRILQGDLDDERDQQQRDVDDGPDLTMGHDPDHGPDRDQRQERGVGAPRHVQQQGERDDVLGEPRLVGEPAERVRPPPDADGLQEHPEAERGRERQEVAALEDAVGRDDRERPGVANDRVVTAHPAPAAPGLDGTLHVGPHPRTPFTEISGPMWEL